MLAFFTSVGYQSDMKVLKQGGMAAATFGLIAGSMIGGPLSEFIIRRKLTQEQMQQDVEIDPAMSGIESDEASPEGRMANMSAVCYKYRYTVKPFLIVPIIGAMFADLINTSIITLFLNLP